jgi:hypothetical protein
MKFVDAAEVNRRVAALPEWSWRRAEAEAAWNAKLRADGEFAAAQAAVGELYARVIAEITEEIEGEQ